MGNGMKVPPQGTPGRDATVTEKSTPKKPVETTPERVTEAPPTDSVDPKTGASSETPQEGGGFFASLNPRRLFGGGDQGGVRTSGAQPHRRQEPQEPQEPERSFLGGLMDGVRSASEKLGQLSEVLNNPFVKHGMVVLQESGLNGMQLGAQVKADIESGKIPAGMVQRLQSGELQTRDVGFMLRYIRDLAGGTLTLKLDSEAARALMNEVPLPPELKPEAIREVQLGPGDKLVLRFSGEPLYDAGAMSFEFGKELELKISGLEEANATSLVFEAEGMEATEMMFAGWHLEATDNKVVDGALTWILKILFAPFLLIAGLFGDSVGTRIEIKDDEDGSTRMRAEALGITVADEKISEGDVEEQKKEAAKARAKENAE